VRPRNLAGPVPLPALNAAPLTLWACHRLLTDHTVLGPVGAWPWLYDRIAKHRAARYEDGMFNRAWAPPTSPGPGGDCWLSVADFAAWLTAEGRPVAHPADPAPAAPRRPGRDTLAVLIEREQRQCTDPLDVTEVWGSMLALADSEDPPEPIIGRAIRKGKVAIKWQSDASEPAAFLTRDALAKRLGRQAEAP
jgi:hypothetical protein